MTQTRQHKYAIGQEVCTDNDTYKGRVEIRALQQAWCECHSAPIYGCTAVAEDLHFSFCEEFVAPLTLTQKRKLN